MTIFSSFKTVFDTARWQRSYGRNPMARFDQSVQRRLEIAECSAYDASAEGLARLICTARTAPLGNCGAQIGTRSAGDRVSRWISSEIPFRRNALTGRPRLSGRHQHASVFDTQSGVRTSKSRSIPSDDCTARAVNGDSGQSISDPTSQINQSSGNVNGCQKFQGSAGERA